MSAPPAPAAGQAAARPRAAPLPARAPGPADAPARDYRGSHASADLRAEPAAARRARRLTRDTLTRWGLAHLADEAETIASELIANAAAIATQPRRTLPAIIFALHHRHGELRITAWDNGPDRPRPAEPAPDAEKGRGLAIIDHLTGRNWGWWPTPISAGKVVWAALPAPAADDPDDRQQDTPC